ncbi:unnamed protein product [Paramecium primaurelia]|uniref:Uncharacterized protein n=1 Tax=Paramecium primaurelia TaxID=5886 RepID=A0A8S1P1C7_PARPR|nr:unnamed protein product [Paramecium primaurelia]
MELSNRYHIVDHPLIDDPMLDEGYTRKFGSYKPKFHGSLPGYYPFEFKDYIYVLLFTLLTCGVCIPIWYGLVEGAKTNSKQFSIISAVSFFGFYFIQTLATYYGGRLKKVVENKMIQDKLIEMEKKEVEKQKLLAAI